MATKCIYNGILIHDVLTEGITQQVQYDSSGRDAIFVRSVISCRGTVYTAPSPSTPRDFGHPVSESVGLAPALDNIMGRLSQPKREFIYKIGGKTLFHVVPASFTSTFGGVYDMNNGPRPSARWLTIIGEKSATVQFSVEVATYLCGQSGQPSGVTNYHFWVADEIDENWMTTRIFQGQLRVSSLRFSVHQFRALALPRLAPGFQRESISFNESQDGMTLDFQIRDREKYITVPRPATKWTANHVLSFPHIGNVYAESEIRLRLEADKDTPKVNLITLAFRIMKQKLHLSDSLADGGNVLLSATFGDDITSSGIEASARVKHMNPVDFTNAKRTFGKAPVLPRYVPDLSSHPAPTASLSGVFYQALYQDACNAYSDLSLKPLTNIDYRLFDKQPKREPRPQAPQEVLYGTDQLRDPQSKNYARYFITSQIATRSGNVVLPLASSTTKGKTSATISLFPAQTTRTIKIEADRLNAWPEIPYIGDFLDSNKIWNTLIHHNPTLESMKVSADGVKAIYGLTGEFVYQMSRAPRTNESLPAGIPPYITKNSPLILQSLSPNFMFNVTDSKLA